jgi:hypothetical protein
LLDPRRGFGEPTVEGLRTESLAELVLAGDAPEGIAELYGVSVDLIHTAVEDERGRLRSVVAA